jgi:hypothetical protein
MHASSPPRSHDHFTLAGSVPARPLRATAGVVDDPDFCGFCCERAICCGCPDRNPTNVACFRYIGDAHLGDTFVLGPLRPPDYPAERSRLGLFEAVFSGSARSWIVKRLLGPPNGVLLDEGLDGIEFWGLRAGLRDVLERAPTAPLRVPAYVVKLHEQFTAA